MGGGGRGRDENLAHPKYKALSPARETKKSKKNVTTETGSKPKSEAADPESGALNI